MALFASKGVSTSAGTVRLDVSQDAFALPPVSLTLAYGPLLNLSIQSFGLVIS
jgi:hypothetical protein